MRRSTCIAVLALAACSPKPPQATPPQEPTPPAVPGAGEESGHDFSTPEGTVLAFIDASARGDLELMAECFSIRSDGEFHAILDGTIPQDGLNEIGDMFEGASVVGTTMGPDGVTALVKVKLEWEGRPFEEIRVHTEGRVWKITGF